MKIALTRRCKSSLVKIVNQALLNYYRYLNRTSNGTMRMRSATSPKERRLELLRVWGTAFLLPRGLAATIFRMIKLAANMGRLFLSHVKATSRSSSCSIVSDVMASPISSSWRRIWRWNRRRLPQNSQLLSIICSTFKIRTLESLGSLI